ncbi:uncharacterized protein [Oscarella lobularis]|uniref:uncharacterized protein n=1 Tax=Oscarella lobularis TaxID=121494 RepID=UPI0033143214
MSIAFVEREPRNSSNLYDHCAQDHKVSLVWTGSGCYSPRGRGSGCRSSGRSRPSTCPVVTMDDGQFLDTATCVLDVAWAAAVGQFSRDSRGGCEWDETEVEENQRESDIAVMALELFVSFT